MAALKEMLESRDKREAFNAVEGAPNVETLLRKVFQRPAADPGNPLKSAQPRRDPATAYDLLERAGAAFDVLVRKCDQLESRLAEQTERAKAEAAAQDKVIEDWKRLASGMKTHAEETDKRLQLIRSRCETAEARALSAEARATVLQEAYDAATMKAATAEDVSTEFHDKVIATFGIGSSAHATLEEIATKAGLSEPK